MAKILIDADGCPVVDLTIAAAKRFGLPVLLLCDTAHDMQREGAETVTVSKGADAVDFVLVNRVQKGDVVVTQDYGLAAMVLAKQGYPIDQNGRVYSDENIDQLLYGRHVAKKIRQAGGRMKGPKKRRQEDNEEFELKLVDLLEEITSKFER
ncbi:YaiI/YqxD family protein [Planomicrobium sp. CPCC 101110]|uniref:YaiI/YqxD family protein n=1 Tax=Planomicrobium sp. CPCC 101110 TaxID=2599619 RepID=UPI0011B78451|nr:YaiI/YqxD family protein [Planomicrobium sp. CPCC 101110]TWT24752.1 YaiI/YqxD family protein [Planomicrobium sp. CPCC 101110]